MGGVLYSFDPSFDPLKHQQKFDEAMRSLGKESLPVKGQLEGEWEAVNKNILRVYPNKTAVGAVFDLLKDHKLVIVSTSLAKTSKLILKKIGLEGVAWKVFDMSDFGSKKDSGSWKKIFKSLHSVDVIIEDGKENLEAALQAAKELNLTAKGYTSVTETVVNNESE